MTSVASKSEIDPARDQEAAPRKPRNLVFICDGTLSSQAKGEETNAGHVWRLLTELGQTEDQKYEYDPGVQGDGWRKWLNAASGMGVNVSICRGYAFLASHYRPGDRIFLLGFSRGAYAVRSLAGMIGAIGLLKSNYATERYVRLAFRYYEVGSNSMARRHFSQHRCHTDTEIEMLGIWDTVKSLGLPYPLINRLAPMATEFHDDQLGRHIRHGYHALAIDEDRRSYRPLLWSRSQDWQGRLEQVWFPGAHGDVGGEVRTFPAARPLANISLNWMLRRARMCNLRLPDGWDERFPENPAAPMMGCRSGVARLFVSRQPRRVGHRDGEGVHSSVQARKDAVPSYRPRARGLAEPAIDQPDLETRSTQADLPGV
ncbi:MAG: DUF2235 domain-containing protein [Pseudomonadota bacterium]